MSASAGTVRLSIEAGVAAVVFDRPEAHNAMTWAMYGELAAICTRLTNDPSIRVVTLRGAGGKAFVAGTDIEQFKQFRNGDDGLAYEANIDAGVDGLERLPMPVVAILDGWVVGGGLAIASACDLRIATPATQFGVPIARTLGNCLPPPRTPPPASSPASGVGAARRMLLLAEMLSAEEARAAGFVTRIVAADTLDHEAAAMCARIAGLAPLTLRASKETMRRVAAGDRARNDDLIRLCYGSEDFGAASPRSLPRAARRGRAVERAGGTSLGPGAGTLDDGSRPVDAKIRQITQSRNPA